MVNKCAFIFKRLEYLNQLLLSLNYRYGILQMKKLILLILIGLPAMALSQKRYQFIQFEEKHYAGYHFDDDFLFLGNRDEQYTGGLEFELLTNSQKIKEKRGLFNPFRNGQRVWITTFGSYLFTPYNITDSLIILNDRPYSSYIYSTLGYTANDENLEKKLTFELFLGIIGSELPGKIQSKLHTVGDSPPTFGWQHRIAEKETFIPNIHFNYQKNIATIGKINVLNFNWIQLGTQYDLNAGLYLNTLAYGIRISAFNHKPLSNSPLYYGSSASDDTEKRKLRVTTYFNPMFQYVAYNTTLQSLPWLDSPYVITSDLIERGVWMMEAGVNLTYKRFHTSYLFRARSKEFRKFQQEWHTWAGITMGWSF